MVELPRGAAVLAGHPGRPVALFEEAGFIDGQHGLVLTQTSQHVLAERIAARRRNFERYKAALGSVPGIEFMPIASYGKANHWLTCITIDPEKFGATREDVRIALANRNIEARPVWKPLHLQPVFAHCRVRGGAVAAGAFEHGLCLPSGSNLTSADFNRVCAVVLGARRQR